VLFLVATPLARDAQPRTTGKRTHACPPAC
jgi:hypothetical protein